MKTCKECEHFRRANNPIIWGKCFAPIPKWVEIEDGQPMVKSNYNATNCKTFKPVDTTFEEGES